MNPLFLLCLTTEHFLFMKYELTYFAFALHYNYIVNSVVGDVI